ncbi:hypothetical protein NMW93_001278 [Salmonella enterica]|nr:hypothetical protein [Salmonella enterica]EAQ5599868.1 hypothetical protein [Salmonella enterica]EAS0493801.1 hypothetical protein [Salmonella enterica]EAS7073470.1 hypothetical protein [Salmonella enterica]EAV9372330.1 hypothetical protein [Salmonella enterica]
MEALTIPVKLYIHYNANTFSPDKYTVAACDMSRRFPDTYVLLEIREITLDINQPEPFDIIALQVDQLRGQKETIAAEAQRQIARVDDKIQQLLCIDHTPVQESDIPF